MLSLWHGLPRGLKHRIARSWYEAIAWFDRRGEILFLNHGYAPVEGDGRSVDLGPEDEPNRYAIQLYHHVAGGTDWTGRDALEVASGRGGGAAYLMRAFRPRSFRAVDLAASGIAFSRRTFQIPGLTFEVGDALHLPVPDGSVDIVLNIESSNNFPGKAAFFREVARVLRPGGHFLFADYRRGPDVERLRRRLAASGLEIERELDISRNILRALELDDARKQRIIDERVPKPLRSAARRFAFVRSGEGDEHSNFARGEKVYLSFVLSKPSTAMERGSSDPHSLGNGGPEGPRST